MTAPTDPALALVEVRSGVELAGYGLFVADGVVLVDGTTAENLGDGEAIVRVTRQDYPATIERHGSSTFLRVDAPAHSVAALADPGGRREDPPPDVPAGRPGSTGSRSSTAG